eukprot:TRINITY_DN12654_c0_g1_i2.p1 TRINITY_DN12654_c0_g1~~TRINITY_DN12654_c0_g1_i2.p1  ORF type:complete len:314 (-),score=102.85 TRINITY_DN12654_c0_g1_i2:58-999(-)
MCIRDRCMYTALEPGAEDPEAEGDPEGEYGCTTAQLAALGDLMQRAREAAVLCPPHVLVRFLQAKRFDVEEALEAVLVTENWRSFGPQRANNILQEFEQEGSAVYVCPSKLRAVSELWEFGYHHTDKQGRPLFINRIGQGDPTQLLEVLSVQEHLLWHVQQREDCYDRIFPACSHSAGRLVDKTLSIIDVGGLNAKVLSNPQFKEAFKELSALDEAHYPEFVGRCIVINTSFMVRMAWKVISAFLNPKSVSKVAILGTDYKETLLQEVHEHHLPAFLGGACQCTPGCLQASPGPWSEILDSRAASLGLSLIHI